MIKFISRKKVFEKYNNIGLEISSLQKAVFEDDPSLFETKQDQKEYNRSFDAMKLELKPVNQFYKKISFEHEDIESFTSVLSKKLISLLTALQTEQLIIISHLKLNFFGASLKHRYPPVKKAYKRLKDLLKTSDYKEAILIEREDLCELAEIFFWIERCDASAPEYIFFHDVRDRFSFFICKSGNIHVTGYNVPKLTTEILHENGWHEIEGPCYDKFSPDGKIKGRITSM